MTKAEIVEMFAYIKVAFPNSYKNITDEDKKTVYKLWYKHFKDYPNVVVMNAVDSIIASDTSGFAPTVGKIKEMILKITANNSIDADEAWNMVSSALRNSIYHAEEEFNKLPIEVQAGVGNPNQLREWAQMDSDTVQSVIGSNFKKGYRGRVEEKKEYEKLPSSAKQMIKQLSNGMKMIE